MKIEFEIEGIDPAAQYEIPQSEFEAMLKLTGDKDLPTIWDYEKVRPGANEPASNKDGKTDAGIILRQVDADEYGHQGQADIFLLGAEAELRLRACRSGRLYPLYKGGYADRPTCLTELT